MSADTLWLNLAVFLVGMSGFVLLALAMERQGEWLLHRVPTPRQRTVFRVLGWPLLFASLALCFMAWGWSIGAVAWLGWLNMAGMLLVFALPYWPWATRRSRHVRTPPNRAARQAAVAHAQAASAQTPAKRAFAWRALVVALLVLAPPAYLYGVWQASPQAVMRDDAFQGQVGPWAFTLAEIDRKRPEISPSGVPVKTFQIRFCDTCDDEIRTAFLKVRKPRSTRSVGLSFFGQRRNRSVEISIPPAAKLEDKLWLSVEGKDGAWHYLAIDFEQVSPATAAFIKEMNP